MEWIDEGIVLGVKRHGETSVILELMTHGRGRHLGLVRGGSGARLRAVLQPGNSLRATWRARLDDHLGHYLVEGINLRAAGEPYRDKLMRLPRFLQDDVEAASAADLADAFTLAGFFLERHAFAPRGLALPDARARFVAAVLVRSGQPRYPVAP